MTHSILIQAAVLFGIAVLPSSASLINQDFLVSGDRLLIDDTATHLEWHSPVYTKNHTYNDAFVASVISTYGFRYATASEADSMIQNNFGHPPVTDPGTPAGYTDAQNFFSVFGITEVVGCPGGSCPRTQ